MPATTQRLVSARAGRLPAAVGPAGRRPAAALLARSAPPIRARSAGALLDLALEVLVRRLGYFASVSTALWILANSLTRAPLGDDAFAALAGWTSELPLALLVQQLTMALVVVVVYGELQGQRVTTRRAVLLALRRLPALFAFTLLLASGALCLILPAAACWVVGLPFALALALLMAWLLAVAPAAIVLEGLGPLAAARRSAEWMRGAFGTWVAVEGLQFLFAAPLASASAALADPRVAAALGDHLPLPPLVQAALRFVLGAAFQGIATALGAVVLAVLYVDRRIRLEGFDLAMRLERIEARHPPRSAEARP